MNYEDLFKTIELVRMKLIEVGMTQGLTSPKTIRLSELLDKLINLTMSR